MLTEARLEHILARMPNLRVGVLGDVFLDRYLDIDPRLTEASVETGLDAYQVVRVRSLPGAAGTVVNNLAALGVGRVDLLSVIGDDGEGYELRRALEQLRCVSLDWVVSSVEVRTPTYTKPMLRVGAGAQARELNRLDIKNRAPVPADVESRIVQGLGTLWPSVDVLAVLDQVSEADCGVVTQRVRDLLLQLAQRDPERPILADSRERIGLFRGAWLKPNEAECLKAVGRAVEQGVDLPNAVQELAGRCGRPVFCTHGSEGMLVCDPRDGGTVSSRVPAFPVSGPIDSVGAGDSCTAALCCALAAGGTLFEAAAFANLVASITIQQLGTTGTASPLQVRQRWQEICRATG